MPVKDAVDDAVGWAIEENLLDGFFRVNKAEVIAMCLTEFDVESAIKTWREDGYEDGYNEGITEGMTAGEQKGKQEKAVEDARNAVSLGLSPQQISQITGLPLEEVQKLAAEINAVEA